MTGTRTSVIGGSVVVRDTGRNRASRVAKFSLSYDGLRCAICAFVDNFNSFANNAYNAILILDICESHLRTKWSHRFGADSKQIMDCNDNNSDIFENDKGTGVDYKHVSEL